MGGGSYILLHGDSLAALRNARAVFGAKNVSRFWARTVDSADPIMI